MPFLMMPMIGVPQYSQWTVTEPDKDEMHRRSAEYQTSLPGFPLQLSHRGIRLPEILFPNRATIAKNAKKPPHFISIWMFEGVSQTVRDLIEEVEPGVHQFRPIDVFLKSGEHTPMSYSMMNVCSLTDKCVDFDRTTGHHISGQDNGRPRLFPNTDNPISPIYLKRGTCGDRHLWRSKEMAYYLVISDALRAQFDRAKVRGHYYVECIEV